MLRSSWAVTFAVLSVSYLVLNVLFALAYYECPQLCSLVLDAAARAIHALGPDWLPGDRYRAITISFDPSHFVFQAFGACGSPHTSLLNCCS